MVAFARRVQLVLEKTLGHKDGALSYSEITNVDLIMQELRVLFKGTLSFLEVQTSLTNQ